VNWSAVLDELGNGPQSADLFQVLRLDVGRIPDAPRLILRLIEGLADPGAAQEVAAVVCANHFDAATAQRHFEVFRGLAANRNLHYGTRSAALRAALYLAQFSQRSLFYLQGDLIGADLADDPLFLRHLAAVAGLVAANNPSRAFVELLQSLTAVREAEDEASYAIGMIDLASALGETDRGRAIEFFSTARKRFNTASTGFGGRPDAAFYASAIDIVLAFVQGAPARSIKASIDGLLSHVFRFVAHFSPDSRGHVDLSWMGQRAVEASHWAAIGLAISRLTEGLDRSAWLKPIVVLEEELFFLLSASRTFFRRTEAGGFEAAITPRVEAHFIKEKAKLSLLDQWLETKESQSWRGEAIKLRDGVRNQLEALAHRNPIDAAGGASPLAALDSSEATPASERQQARALIDEVERKFSLAATDPILNDILEGMIIKLRGNEDFEKYEAAAALFITVLRNTLKFVSNRDNARKDSATAYLFDHSQPGPTEDVLHADYMNSLRMSDLARVCTLEPQDVGGGRADVQFQYEGFTIVSECKRAFHMENNSDALLRFGAQPIAYQVSSVTFAAIVILDLAIRGDPPEHLRDRATLEDITVKGREWAIAVFRVPGRRKSPSQQELSKPAVA
jgi:hypothetical protein